MSQSYTNNLDPVYHGVGHQLHEPERFYTRLKETEENALLKDVEEGTVKVSSDEWRERCEFIEQLELNAHYEREKYENND
jgi:hypothetical protein